METKLNQTERAIVFGRLFWDYFIPADEVEKIISSSAPSPEKQKVFLRLLYSAHWYTLKKILTPSELKELLDDSVISKIHIPTLRAKYQYVRRILYS